MQKTCSLLNRSYQRVRFLLMETRLQRLFATCLIVITLAISVVPAAAIKTPAPEKIIVGGEIGYPPYSFLDKNGNPSGFSVELTQAIARIMGMDIEIRLRPWPETRKALEEGTIDIIPGMFYSEERAKIYDLSPPFAIVSTAIFARVNSPPVNSIEDLRNKEIIVMRGEVMHDYVLKHRLTDRLVLTETPADALRLLASGKGDYALVAQMPGFYWIKELKLSNIKSVGPSLEPFKNCYAVRKGNAILLSRFTEGFNILNQTGEYHTLYNKWLGVLEPSRITFGLAVKYAAIVIVPLILLLAVSVLWSWMLRSSVRQKTKELKESAERFRSLVSNIPGIVYRCANDANWTMLFISHEIDPVSDYPASDFINNAVRSYASIIHPGDLDLVDLAVQKGVKEKTSYTMEYRICRADGHIRWVREQGQGVFAPNGILLWLDGVILDITNRKQAEEALQKSEKKYRLIFENTPIGHFFFDENGVIVECNNNFVSIIGSTREALIGLNMINLPDKNMVLTVQEALSGRIGRYEDVYHSVTAKKATPMRALFAPMISEGGDILGGVGIIEDITERKQAEVARWESEVKFRSVVEKSPLGIAIVDDNFMCIYVNKEMSIFSGYPEQEMVGANFSLLLSEESKAMGIERYQRRQRGEDTPSRYEFSFVRKTGEARMGEVWGATYIDSSGRVNSLIQVIDITERKQAEEDKAKLEAQLQQSQKMEAIGTLAGGIAHDFNNILAAIIGYTEMAVEEDQNEIQKQYLQETLSGAERARNLVKQILTFSRQDDHEKKHLDIKVLLQEAVKFLRSSIPTTIEINQHLAEESCNILADPTQMHQIIMNLCTNASHAMKEAGGTLKIELTNVELAKDEIPSHPDLQTGHYIKLTISDTGHGIDPALIQRIFDPFFTTKSVDEGTGLGLSVVYGIVKSHGGIINVYSEPDKGAAFHVYLPRITYGEDMKVDRRKPVTGGTERILFVDDEPALVDLGRRMLSSLGYEVESVLSSVEALDLFHTKPESFDLVITDMTLPKMTGIDLSRELLKIRPNIPIILCSGIKDPDTEAQVKSIGIKSYIMKPLTKRELAGVMREVLDGRE